MKNHQTHRPFTASALATALVISQLVMPNFFSIQPASHAHAAPLVINDAHATTPVVAPDAPTDTIRERANAALARAPLAFEANAGQAGAGVKFMARGAGYAIFLTDAEAFVQLHSANSELQTSKDVHTNPLRLKLLDANRAARVSGEEALPGKSNYFIGGDAARWRTGVTTYAKVRYAEIYSGIDMIYYGHGQQLEYDFNIAPNADASRIRLRFTGAKTLRLDERGDLLIETAAGTLRQHKPTIYQETNGARREIAGGYVLRGKREIGFQIGDYDHAKPLVIDPTLVYSDAVGGNGFTRGNAIAVDAAGNAYIAGQTSANNFPVVNPFQRTFGGGFFGDAFVLKLNPSGTAFVYATYIGGNSTDLATGIAIDANGNAYVTGITASANFPSLNGFQNTKTSGRGFDAFVTKLNAAGNALVYSTFLHGNDSIGGEPKAIAVDSTGSAYITGSTSSKSFPILNGAQTAFGGGFSSDAFLTKFTPAGNALAYSTYLGGDAFDLGTSVAVDSTGNAYVAGSTMSTNFPTANAFQATKGKSDFFTNFNAFVTKINTNATGAASLVYSTYLGGQFNDQANGIAVDSSGSAYVTGQAQSDNFPTTAGALKKTGSSNAFVTKFAPAGNALVYSTYLGGNADSAAEGAAIAVDAQGNAFVTGTTSAPDFPLKNATQTTGGGGFFFSTNAAGAWSVGNRGLPDTSTTSILVDPTNPLLVYQSNQSNGVSKSSDGGITWTPANTGITPPSITSLAFDPTNSATLYAVTFFGVFKTTNSGNSWTKLGGGLPDKQYTAFAASSATMLYTGTSDGKVFRSADGGGNWTDLSGGLPTNGVPIKTLAAAPTAPVTIYAGFSQNFGSSNGVYKIAENQTTWTAANTGLSGISDSGAQFINALVVDPTNPNTIYVATNGSFNVANGGIYKTVNGGGNWTPLVRTEFDNLSLAIDPTNAANIYVGTQSNSGRGILKSTDAGATWTASGLTNNRTVALAISRAAPSTVYAGVQGGTDQFVSVINPSGSALLFSTYYGGTGADFGKGIALNSQGNAYVTGTTFSNDFPKTPGTPRAHFGDDFNAASQTNAEPFGDLKETIAINDLADATFGNLSSDNVTPPCPIISIDNKKLTEAPEQVGKYFLDILVATGGTYTFSFEVSSGNLPQGLRLGTFQDAVADIRGTPNKAGTYKFTITATDKNGCRGSHDFTLTILPVPKFIKGFEPQAGSEGTVINLNGLGLNSGQSPAEGKAIAPSAAPLAAPVVKFNGTPAEVISVTDTQIKTKVPVGATTGFVTVTIGQDTLTSPQPFYVSTSPNAIDETPFFVIENYRDFLNREPDSSGQTFWNNTLNSLLANCNSVTPASEKQKCILSQRAQVSAAFFLSIEFQQTGYYALRFYGTAFGNGDASKLPLTIDFQEFLFFAQTLQKGVIVGQMGYEQILEQNKAAFASAFVNRPDFKAFYDGKSNADYINTLFANGGAATGDETALRASLLSGLNNGTETRATVLRKIADSKTIFNKQYNPAFVLLQYFGYLRRNPNDAPDTDLSGFNFWLNKLNQFTLPNEDAQQGDGGLPRVRRAQMVEAFIDSTEYRKRFLPQ